MSTSLINKIINKGIYNTLDSEVIPKEAASDSLNWRTNRDHIELNRGQIIVGAEVTGAGKVQGEFFGYKANGVPVHYKKIGSELAYFNTVTETWDTIISGLDPDSEATFAPYVSRAGHFTIMSTPAEGMFKIHNANPSSYYSLYDVTKNFKGYILIDKARTFLWGNPDDPTGLYLSFIDSQKYTTVTGEVLAAGDGSTVSFSGTLAFVQRPRTAFGVLVVARTATATNITAITKASQAQVTSASHGLVVGDKVYFASISGMTQLNGVTATVTSVVDANNFTINIDTTAYTAYSSGGTAQRTEQFIDNKNGQLVSNKDQVGTINYLTGAYSITFAQTPINSVNITCSYQWEDSNDDSIGDFTYSATRVAGEGDVFRQDEGGDPIVNVEIHDGAYFSIKQRTVYRLTLSSDDTNATNEVFRKGIGMPNLRASVSTGKGIMFINTANLEKPELTIIRKNVTGDALEAANLIPQFDLSAYEWDDAAMTTFGEVVVFSGRRLGKDTNDRVFEYNPNQESVDVHSYRARTFAQALGLLYAGDSLSKNVYNIFSGFDDDGFELENFWIGNDEDYDTERLKKLKRARFKGLITKDLKIKVYCAYDGGNFEQVGTILGTGSYVDKSKVYAVGSSMIGKNEIGGGTAPTPTGVNAYSFFLEMKVRSSKFRIRKWKFVAEGLGFCTIAFIHDKDVMVFDARLPSKYRQKDNVSLDGTETDLSTPE